jgi:aldehyde dehydrogenase (NAD+)
VIALDVIDRPELFVGGRWTRSDTTTTNEVRNPATGRLVGRFAQASVEDARAAVAAARASFDGGEWAATDPAVRAQVLRKAADLLESRADELAVTLTSELGCPLWFSRRAHVPNPIRHLRYYADLTKNYPYEEERGDGAFVSLVTQEPAGVVAAITPWNGPLSTPTIKVAPALGAGCSVVLKPSPETPLTVYALAEALTEAGLPDGVLSIIPGGREVGEALVADPEVDKVAFTGSTAAGKRIMARCADRIARVTLELGGKSAAIVLDDAVIDDVVAKLLPMAMSVNGQLCIAQTRVLVSRDRQAALVDALGAAIAGQRVGDPMEPDTVIGPMVSRRQQERVNGYIEVGKGEGARVAVGGGRPPALPPDLAAGWFVEPTLFYDVDNAMRIAQEEIFGPVMAVVPYDSVDEAVRIANDSVYGLSGSVWGADHDRAVAVARRIRTGMVSINGAPQAFGSPFGGYKQSGVGREMGPEGFKSFLETKSIAVGAA